MNSIYEYIFNDVKEIFTGKLNNKFKIFIF